MPELRAFALTDEVKLDELQGATMAFGADTQMLDIKAALRLGDGTIVTDHPDVAAALRSSPILQEVGVPDSTEEAPIQVTPLNVEVSTRATATSASYVPQEPFPGTGDPVAYADALAATSLGSQPVPEESQNLDESASVGSEGNPPNESAPADTQGTLEESASVDDPTSTKARRARR